MLLIPIAFFAVVEGALRLSGFGASYPLFVPVEGKPDYLVQNREVARRYFTNVRNVPSSLADFFRAEKDASTFRIFVQGGSSGAGFPFYYGGSFSRMLEQRLMQTFPDRHIEVINTSMAAVNSYTLLDFVDEILEHAPDAVLIYAGHNEYYGALGVGSSESLGSQTWLIRTYLELADLRLVQALRRLMTWTAGLAGGRAEGEAPSATLMSRMVGDQSIPYGSADFERGLRQFRSNLSRLLAAYAARGVPVFIGTLASNERDHPPFVAGEGSEADVLFKKARMLEEEGRFDEARQAYLAAKDRDELRFRASEEMNAIIRELASRYGAVVVETQDALAARSDHGIIGSTVMTEHLHPNVEGYFVIADAFYEALRSAGLIGSWDGYVPRELARREVLLTEVDSLVGIFRVRQLMSAWPFEPPGVTKPWMDSVDTSDPIARIALDLFNGEIRWTDANDALRRHYEQEGDFHLALKAALAMVQELPFTPEPYLAAGNVLMHKGRADEALTYFDAANHEQETALGHRMIGSILLHQGRRRQALEHLERSVALDPADRTALYNLGGAYALEGEFDDARRVVTRLLELEPNHQAGRRLLASLPPG